MLSRVSCNLDCLGTCCVAEHDLEPRLFLGAGNTEYTPSHLVLCGAEDETQGFLQAGQTFYQLNYISRGLQLP